MDSYDGPHRRVANRPTAVQVGDRRHCGKLSAIHSLTHACLKNVGTLLIRTDESESTERIVPRIIEGTQRSAFVIADVSELSANVYYELGSAQGFGKKVIVTARKGSKLPFDISDVPVIFWTGQENLKEQLRKRVKAIAEGFVR